MSVHAPRLPRRLLIANRGEIACRIIRTARRLGIETVAVHSDADAGARHVRLADRAERIGPPAAAQSYLDIEALLAAAQRSGADAVHPGYGFLSENAGFAEACAAAGLVFVGPPPAAIRAMGSKSEAKRLLEEAGVPLAPGYHGERQDAESLAAEAARIGWPLLIKASAGGGGKGIRRVDRAEDFAAALAACQREAQSSFGDAQVLLERFIERPRHIEIQVFADRHGGCLHLGERDCSIQRRHPKVLEEAPAPGMTSERRAAMGQAAVAAARRVGYEGAGTVEFIAAPDGTFFFMEMNTRLQVEHPVTEMITGLDLVEWQLRIACGEPLPLAQDQVRLEGHAIEVRLYAEDPSRGFLPSPGRLLAWQAPEHLPGVRVDAGVERDDAITPHYDAMIAKIIAHGASRTEALARLQTALRDTVVAGPRTNLGFLRRLLATRSVLHADLDTALIEREQAVLLAAEPPLPESLWSAALGAWIQLEAGEKMAFKVTDAILNGTGAGQPLGVLKSGCLVTVTKETNQAASTVLAENVLKMYSRMPARNRANAVWVINQDVEALLPQMAVAVKNVAGTENVGGFPVYIPPGGLTGAQYGVLLGRPIVMTEASPALSSAGDVVLGDFSQYVAITKGQVRAEQSMHFYFDQNMRAFRFVMRMGGMPWLSAPIARKNGSNTLSHFVALGAR